VFVFVFVFMFGFVSAQGPGLGHPISEADVAAWDISILPDGTGLPPGNGTPEQGSKVFAAKCAVCHGENGKGGSAAALVGGQPLTSGIETTKTVANFWPYATTIFDFTRRAMPWPRPRTLTNEEVYALTAFLLYLRERRKPLCPFKTLVIDEPELLGDRLFVSLLLGLLRYFLTEPDGFQPPPARIERKTFGKQVTRCVSGADVRVSLWNPGRFPQDVHELRISVFVPPSNALLVRGQQVIGTRQRAHRSPDEPRDR